MNRQVHIPPIARELPQGADAEPGDAFRTEVRNYVEAVDKHAAQQRQEPRVLSLEQTLRDEIGVHQDIVAETERLATECDATAREARERAEKSRDHVRNLRAALVALGMPE